MAGSVYDWSTTAASNGTADAGINFAEGQAPSTVNDSARQLMGREAELLKDLGGGIAAGGTANALTLTAASAFTTLADGRIVAFRAIADNAAGVTTINVNAISAKSIRKMVGSGETDLAAGDIKNGGIFVLRYGTAFNGAAGAWMLQNPVIDLPNLVTLTGTQTLTNKTLTSPTINTPTIATPTMTGGTSSGMTLSTATLNSPSVSGAIADTNTAGQAIGVSGAPAAGTSGLQVSTINPATGAAAFISFNRSAAFAANFGIDTDNIWKVGGWSMGANAYALLHEGLASGIFTGSYTFSGTLNVTGALQKSGVALPFTKSFESTQQTITAGGALTLAHGLGAQPKFYLIVLQCVTAELNFSIGDEIGMPMGLEDPSSAKGVAVVPDATNLNIRFGSNNPTFNYFNKTTGAQNALTNANWKFVVRAWA